MDGRAALRQPARRPPAEGRRASRRPKDVLGYHVGAPRKLTYYADILKYYRALAAATPRVKIETIGKSDEDRELVVVWVSSDANIKNLQQNRDNLARLADPRGVPDATIKQLIATTKPHYHLMGGLHSGETGPPEMLMELVYRLAAETSPFISQIRDNVYRLGDAGRRRGRARPQRRLFYCNQDCERRCAGARPARPVPGAARRAPAAAPAARGGAVAAASACACRTGASTSTTTTTATLTSRRCQMRAITDWYFTAHPPIMHDLHESLPLLYTYSGGPPQNPNLDPILFAELPFFSNWELAQMTKWGMPGVYTHAFMDGWSPGYLGSVAYNHNGMMRMYETQSGRDGGPGPAAAGARRWPRRPAARRRGAAADAVAARRRSRRHGAVARGAGGGDGRGRWRRRRGGGAARGGAARRRRRRRRRPGARAAPAGGGGGGRGGVPTGRGGGQDREWYRGIPVPPNAAANFTRRNNTNYMQTGVLSALQLTAMFPNLVARELLHEDAELDRTGPDAGAVRLRDSGAARHDEAGRARAHPARAGHRSRPDDAPTSRSATRRIARRLVRHQGRPAVLAPREEPAREAGLSRIPRCAPTTTAAGRWATRSTWT